MINKKNVLGKVPHNLGDKDAIHVAIVAVRAAQLITPGQKCSLNKDREAVPDNKNGIGVADPFVKSNIKRGQEFWLLLNQDEVPNVKHVWEHPNVDFSPPIKNKSMNQCIKDYAEQIGCDYDDLIDICTEIVDSSRINYAIFDGNEFSLSPDYPDGDYSEIEDLWDLWSEWAEETGYEFENEGSACCPEYDYPRTQFLKKASE